MSRFSEFRWRKADLLASDRVVCDGYVFFIPRTGHADSALEANLRAGRLRALHNIKRLRDVARGNLMLDVGANIGTTSIPRAVMKHFRHIHAFEPEKRNFDGLVEAIDANDVADRVTAWPLAVGDRCETAEMKIRLGIGRHRVKYRTNDLPFENPVSVTTLDAWGESAGIDMATVDFVKVDTQGFEAKVLAGARGLLTLRHAVWMIEFAPSLIRSSNDDPEALIGRLQGDFDRFIDLGHSDPPRPMNALPAAVSYVMEQGFTDIVLYPAGR